MYLEHTPIEEHSVAGRTIYVKRDDLFAQPPAPPLAKLRGIRLLLETQVAAGTKTIGCFQTRVSEIGHALAAACQEFRELRCVVIYPQSKQNPIPDSVEQARDLGAIIRPIRTNVLPICYAQAKHLLDEMQGMLLPFGMECSEAVDAVASEAATVPTSLCRGATVVVACGSGVTLAGIIRGLPARPKKLIGVSCGRSTKKIVSCINKHAKISSQVRLVEPLMPYYERALVDCPFPAQPFYDLKAWQFLLTQIERLHDPILFWNVGA